MTTAVAKQDNPDIMERVLVTGDLEKLTSEERVMYYMAVCRSVGLNPLTKPFEYLRLNGKLTLYALKGATDQVRKNYRISVRIVSRERIDDLYVVTAEATDARGRVDTEIGAVSIGKLQGDALANAMMKAVTKAKRRVTLSIAGLGMLDETEVDGMASARPAPEYAAELATVELQHIDDDGVIHKRERGTVFLDDDGEPLQELRHDQRAVDQQLIFDRASIIKQFENSLNGSHFNQARRRARSLGLLDDLFVQDAMETAEARIRASIPPQPVEDEAEVEQAQLVTVE